jgi:hypothetical protein
MLMFASWLKKQAAAVAREGLGWRVGAMRRQSAGGHGFAGRRMSSSDRIVFLGGTFRKVSVAMARVA